MFICGLNVESKPVKELMGARKRKVKGEQMGVCSKYITHLQGNTLP